MILQKCKMKEKYCNILNTHGIILINSYQCIALGQLHRRRNPRYDGQEEKHQKHVRHRSR